MSMVVAERGLTPVSAGSDRMPGGITLSVTLHLAVATLILLGLPNLFPDVPPPPSPIAVDLVMLAPHTRATQRNPSPPVPHAKPVPPVENAEAINPPPKPPPPIPTPPPPAPAPPQPAPAPVSAPPKPAPVLAPVPPPPPPKPVVAPKPPPPPPQHVERNQSNPTQKKANSAAFESLLRNLTDKPAPRMVDTPAPQPPRRVAEAEASSQPQAPLGSQLTANEMDLVARQIEACWNVPAGARDAKDLVIEVHVDVNIDGTVQDAAVVDTGRYQSDPFFRAAADSAIRAVRNPRCSPLRLPPDKYDAWKTMDLFFNPKDIL
jgi:hypothetical protein